MNRTIFRILLATALATSAHAGNGNATSTYTHTTSSSVSWVSPVGADVILSPGSSATSAIVNLAAPAVLYGEPTRQLNVSRHGYISWDETDDGADNTFDCPLPKAPSNGGGARRLYPLHGNHDIKGVVTYHYASPGFHPDNRWGAHVITWEGASLIGGSSQIDFQVLIFDDFEVIYQYQTSGSFGEDITVGIQGAATGSDFISVICDDPGAFSGDFAIRFQPPTLVVDNINSSVDMANLFDSLAIDGQRICFNYTNTPSGLVGDPTANEKTLALVGQPGQTFTGGVVRSNGTKDSIAVLGINFKGLRLEAEGPAVVREVSFSDTTSSAVVSDDVADVSGCDFTNCDQGNSEGGGAIRAPEVHAVDSDFADCDATGAAIITQGGAIKVIGSADSALTRCTFTNNISSGAGGAVYAIGGGRLDMTDCTFDSNSSDGTQTQNTGGAVVLSGTDSTVQRCLFINNDGGRSGGALTISGTSSVLLRNSALDANSADDLGAINHGGDLLDIRHCNIVRNTVNTVGAYVIGGNDSPIVSKYSLYTRNFDPDLDFQHIDPASTKFTTLGWNGFDETDSLGHPFTDAEDFSLSVVSEAITVLPGGTPRSIVIRDRTDITTGTAGGSATDLRGNPRLLGSSVDIGAFEYLGSVTVDSLDDDPTPGGPISLREAWSLSDDEIAFDPALAGGTITLTSALPTRIRPTSVRFPAAADLDGQFVTIDGAAASALTIDERFFWRNVRFANFPGYALETNSESSQSRGVFFSEFTGNGGAIDDSVSQNPLYQISNCRFYENGTGATPLPLIDTARIDVDQSQFDHNLGTVFNLRPNTQVSGSLELTNSTIARNATRAIHVPATTDSGNVDITILLSTISTNAADNGSTIVCDHPTALTIDSSTIANNGGDTSTLDACIVATGPSTITTEDSLFENNKRIFSDETIVNSGDYNIFDEALEDSALAANDLVNTKSHLAALSRYRSPALDVPGSVQPELTHALLAISPAIDSTPSTGDFDGDGDGIASRDRGAFEAGPVTLVTTTADSGAGSLRQAVIDAPDGGRILFASSLEEGSTVTLATELSITKDLQIDATNRRRGMTISGGNVTRIFNVSGGARFAIHALGLQRGAGETNFSSALRIRDGWGTATHSSVRLCSARRGTAAYVEAGGLYLLNFTIGDNDANASGAALDFLAGTENRLEHCTIAHNSSATGGAVRLREGSVTRGAYNLIVNNELTPSGTVADFFVEDETTFADRFISEGYNYTTDSGTGIVAAFTHPRDMTAAWIELPSGFNLTGWGAAIVPPSTSVARNQDADGPIFPTFDQSGFARSTDGAIDIGASEIRAHLTDNDNDGLPDWWEFLYGFEPFFTNDAAGNPDNDADDNLTEFQNGTDPRSPNVSVLPVLPRIISVGRGFNGSDSIVVQFDAPDEKFYDLQSSSDLVNWTTFGTVATSGGTSSLELPVTPGRFFFRFAMPQEIEED